VSGRATALYLRAVNWAIGSDPGLLRLRMAARTTVSLAVALLILFLLTKATHQPLTVALLGVLITMVAGRAVNEPDPRQQKITMALLPLPAAVAITSAAPLSPRGGRWGWSGSWPTSSRCICGRSSASCPG